MTLTTMLLLVAVALVVGVLVGCVGVGGVLLPPTLAYVGGLDLHLAAATSIWAFLFTGFAGTAAYTKRRSVDWRMVSWLGAGVVPAAVLGARSNVALPVSMLTILLAALIVATGASALSKPPVVERPARAFGGPALVLIGAVVGFGSAVTGTGGPALLVPLLTFMRVPVLVAVGASQVIQIPVAAFATVGYVLYGRVDFALGTALGIIAVFGVVLGTRVAHAVPASTLRRTVAVSLIVVGLLMGAQVLGG